MSGFYWNTDRIFHPENIIFSAVTEINRWRSALGFSALHFGGLLLWLQKTSTWLLMRSEWAGADWEVIMALEYAKLRDPCGSTNQHCRGHSAQQHKPPIAPSWKLTAVQEDTIRNWYRLSLLVKGLDYAACEVLAEAWFCLLLTANVPLTHFSVT